MESKITAKPFQFKFLNSTARFPALISAIGTGKTFFMLLKVWNFCLKYPETTALIVRKEYTDLRDSTMKDFERYFEVSVDSKHEFKFSNGSVIMFRHGAELNVLKNINLTIAAIEQVEEFDSDEQFTFIRDRLRKNNAPIRQLIVIGNTNGENWVKNLWKDGHLQESELFEATTFDNEENLPADFISDLKRMELESPAHYRQYVLNDWYVADVEFILIRPQMLEALKGISHFSDKVKRIVSCDPATGGDECVIYVIENGEIVYQRIMHDNDTMKIGAEIVLIGTEWRVNHYAIDCIGVGKGVADYVNKIVNKNGGTVFFVNSAENANSEELYFNKRTEMWWHLMTQILNKEIFYPQDEELRRQLTAVKYEPLKHKKKVRLEDKQKTKSRLKRSPDRADSFVYGIYYLQFVDALPLHKKSDLDRYVKAQREQESELTICNF